MTTWRPAGPKNTARFVVNAALKEFETFPEVQSTGHIGKPMHRMGSGVFEIALPFRGVRTA